MADALSLLSAAHQAVREGRPDTALGHARAFETLLAEKGLAPDDLDRAKDMTRRLIRTAEAAAQGTAEARDKLEQILRLAGRLESYDRTGRRLTEETRPRRGTSF